MTLRTRLVAALIGAMTSMTFSAETLRVHGIFRSHMVLQREKPITIWGWAPADEDVSVSFGEHRASSKVRGEDGRWEVTFSAQPANARGQVGLRK